MNSFLKFMVLAMILGSMTGCGSSDTSKSHADMTADEQAEADAHYQAVEDEERAAAGLPAKKKK